MSFGFGDVVDAEDDFDTELASALAFVGGFGDESCLELPNSPFLIVLSPVSLFA